MSLKRKISISSVAMVVVVMIMICILVLFRMGVLKNSVMENNNEFGSTAEDISIEALKNEIRAHLEDVSLTNATMYDQKMKEFSNQVSLLAGVATEVFSNPDEYSNVTVEEPKKDLDGELSVQLLHSEKVSLDDAQIQRTSGLLGNISKTLKYVNANDETMASCYIASKKGVLIMADYISAAKFDETGHVAPYEADTRPWYQGASQSLDVYFTPVSADASGKGIGIMCGVPFYANDEFEGVAGAGMYLDDMVKSVNELDIGVDGYACVVNDSGVVIISPQEQGALAVAGTSNIDLREGDNKELGQLISDTLSGKSVFQKINIDGENMYIAASPMKTVKWAFLSVVPESEVLKLTDNLNSALEESSIEAGQSANSIIQSTLFNILLFGILVSLICAAASLKLSMTIVEPINRLTSEVSNIEGDNLDFHWDAKIGDETDVLGKAFESLTEKMKEYIKSITEITAEKERISAELNVATQIQEDMLPREFPAFPEIKNIDLYASMDPAKEVGGDFYDFFRIDDKHIGLVMADVSGKGVPAALFMVISKTLVKNQTLLASNQSPSDILASVNDQLCEGNEASLFCTCWLGVLDIETGEMVCSSAGHEYPAIKKASDGKFKVFKDKHGIPLAAMEGMVYQDYTIQIEPGDMFYVYTDGVPEATNSNDELFEIDRMIDALNINPDDTPENLLKTVREEIDKFVGEAPQFDDITMLCIHFKDLKSKE